MLSFWKRERASATLLFSPARWTTQRSMPQAMRTSTTDMRILLKGGRAHSKLKTSTANELLEKTVSQRGTCCMKELMWTAEATARSSRKLIWESWGSSAPGHWKPRSRLRKNIPRPQVDAASTKTSVTSSSDGFQVCALKSRMPGRRWI